MSACRQRHRAIRTAIVTVRGRFPIQQILRGAEPGQWAAFSIFRGTRLAKNTHELGGGPDDRAMSAASTVSPAATGLPFSDVSSQWFRHRL